VDRTELSLLAFLVETAIVSTPGIEQVEKRFPNQQSPEFIAVVKIVKSVARRMSTFSANGDRLAEFHAEAKKLKKSGGPTNKSAGEALEWALGNWEGRHNGAPL
jgi:hypothetical protein